MTFKNKTGWWKYQGKFSIEFIYDRLESIENDLRGKKGVKIVDNKVKIISGEIKKTTRGIEFFVEGENYFWPHYLIMAIYNGRGQFIWKNRIFDKMKMMNLNLTTANNHRPI